MDIQTDTGRDIGASAIKQIATKTVIGKKDKHFDLTF